MNWQDDAKHGCDGCYRIGKRVDEALKERDELRAALEKMSLLRKEWVPDYGSCKPYWARGNRERR